ncbi:MAG: RNA polymerase sigma-70 factor [Mangrovibacterium sp.]|nr:RNA polymerase sigma-70 factor [Mangrovibacterium sp.]
MKNGEEKAFDLLFERYYSNLCHYAASVIHDHDASEDMVQDLFAELWVNHKQITIRSSLYSYLLRSTRNACLDHLKHLKVKEKFQSEAKTGLSETVEDNMELAEILHKMDESIEQLPEQCKRIFKLSRFENLKYREIAKLLNISENTVDTQIRRALNKLKNDLSDYLISIFIIFHLFF